MRVIWILREKLEQLKFWRIFRHDFYYSNYSYRPPFVASLGEVATCVGPALENPRTQFNFTFHVILHCGNFTQNSTKSCIIPM